MGVCDDRKQPRLALLEALSNGRASLRYAAASGQQQRPVPLKQVELIVPLSASSSSDLAHALSATSSSSTAIRLLTMRMYRYLFFRIYRWGLRVHGPEDVPEFNAILGLSVLAVMNVLNILMAAELASGRGPKI